MVTFTELSERHSSTEDSRHVAISGEVNVAVFVRRFAVLFKPHDVRQTVVPPEHSHSQNEFAQVLPPETFTVYPPLSYAQKV